MEANIEKSVSLIDLYKELKIIEQSMVTKAEFNMAFETISILSNAETMHQIKGSEEDIKRGRVRNISSAEEI